MHPETSLLVDIQPLMFRSTITRLCNRGVYPPNLFSLKLQPLTYFAITNARSSSTTMPNPKYLTGDKASIDEFLDKFDVRTLSHTTKSSQENLTLYSAFFLIVMVWLITIGSTINSTILRCKEANLMRRIGVLWSGEQLFARIPETIDMLRQKGMCVTPQKVIVY